MHAHTCTYIRVDTGTPKFVFTHTLLPYILVSILFENADRDPLNMFHNPLNGHDLHFEKHSSGAQTFAHAIYLHLFYLVKSMR